LSPYRTERSERIENEIEGMEFSLPDRWKP
jgi:hypothetical protein